MQPTPLKNLEAYPDYNSNNIFVFDDCFPAYLVDDGIFQLGMMQWEYGHLTDHTNPKNDPFFGRQLYHKLQGGMQGAFPPMISNFISLIEKVLSKQIDEHAIYRGLYRVSCNGQTQNMTAGIHVDTKERNTFWTAVYMVNEADGDLAFYESDNNRTLVDSVPFKTGRIVIFPSGYAHEGKPPTNSKWRVTVGVMFDLDTKKQYA